VQSLQHDQGQKAIIDLTRAMIDQTGNLPPLPGIFPDYGAPIVREGPDGRELVLARWGMPSPLFALKGKKTDPGVTNIRNAQSPHWRRWLEPESRCSVPFTSFSENELTPGVSKQPISFAFDRDRPLAFFAGIWTRWTSIRKVREGEVTADLFGFLTTEPNAEVATVHPQAMPAILTTEELRSGWARHGRRPVHCSRLCWMGRFKWFYGRKAGWALWIWSTSQRRPASRSSHFRCR
jgi:putative SOS response-associated peptidase YedK